MGLAAKELVPVAIGMWNTAQAGRSIEKVHGIQQETYGRMQTALQRESLGERTALRETCEGCKIETAAMRQFYSSTWTHLFSLPAALPHDASPEDREKMAHYITSLVVNLPCKDCTEHGRAYIAQNPVDVSSSEALARWLCRYRNSVNVTQNKPIRPCE